MNEPISFLAEIKETKQNKSVSLDNVYSVRLVTHDPSVLDLGKMSAQTLLKVTCEVVETASDNNSLLTADLSIDPTEQI